jgi:hypothetical protein
VVSFVQHEDDVSLSKIIQKQHQINASEYYKKSEVAMISECQIIFNRSRANS